MFHQHAAQRGSALLISLVILTAITLGAIIAMQRSTLQMRMVGNMQHQQNLFNAAQNNLNSMLEQFRAANKAGSILYTLIEKENASMAQGNAIGLERINPFAQGNLSNTPTYAANIDASKTTNSIRSLSIPSQTANSLKANEGSSAGALAPYYFASRVTAEDKRGNTNTQEIGFYYMAPAQIQN